MTDDKDQRGCYVDGFNNIQLDGDVTMSVIVDDRTSDMTEGFHYESDGLLMTTL